MDEYVAEMQKKGVQFKQVPKNQPWLWREAHPTDPDNNPPIYYAGKNRLDPPWRLD